KILPTIGFVFLCAATGFGQTPPPKVGYMRFWDMLPETAGSFELRKAGAAPGDSSLLKGTPYRYSSYSEFPLGQYQLAVYKKGDRNSPIKILNVNLRPDTYFTI